MKKNFYSKFIRKHHAYHHRYNHGVTSIWENLQKSRNNPENNVMKWLLNENGEIKTEYSSEYELIKKNIVMSEK
jgi:hypothetical protein